MKKIITVLFVASFAFLFSGCNKENVPSDTAKTQVVRASIANTDTKTALDLSGSTSTKPLTWAENDKIYLISPASPAQWELTPYTLTEGEGTATGTFGGTKVWGDTDYMAAFYGNIMTSHVRSKAGWYLTGSPGSGDQTYVELHFPYEQPYRSGETIYNPNPAYLFMKTAKTHLTYIDNLSFDNLVSIVKLPIKGTGHTLASIKLQCTGAPIAGLWYAFGVGNHTTPPNYNVEPFGSNLKAYYGNNKGSSPENESCYGWGNQTTMTNIGVTLTSTPQNFYLVIASAVDADGNPGNHETLTVTLTDTASPAQTKVVTWDSFMTQPGMIYSFPVIDFN